MTLHLSRSPASPPPWLQPPTHPPTHLPSLRLCMHLVNVCKRLLTIQLVQQLQRVEWRATGRER